MDDSQPIPVVTTPRYDNYSHETVGIIHAGATTQGLSYALAAAIKDLQEQATTLGADAVVSVTHSVSHAVNHNNSILYVVAMTGTAVRLPWPLGSASPELLAENPDNLQTR